MKYLAISTVLVVSVIFNVRAQVTWSGDLDPSDPTLWDETTLASVGYLSAGSLTIANGATVFDHIGYIGANTGSTGSATVVGPGSVWTNADSLSVGYSGSGELSVSDGATVYNTLGYIGVDYGSTGTATVSGPGSIWTNSGNLSVGYSGFGEVSVSDGATVYNTLGYIGVDSDSTGSATVVGPGSVWTNSDNLSVGYAGFGELAVSDGATVYNALGYIGYHTNSTGSATVSGSGSVWTNSGNLSVGYSGFGELAVSDSATVYNTLGYIGANSGSTGSVSVVGPRSVWTNSDSLSVGYSGSGKLSVFDGATVYNTLGYIGVDSGSTGSATVTGPGSVWTNSDSLSVGYSGSGKLSVSGGATVYNTLGYIGATSGSTGSVTVTGPGSFWTNSGDLYVGYSGFGELAVSDGATVYNTLGYIGYHTNSMGSVAVSGLGSVWTNSSNLYVGYSGPGELAVSDGGRVDVGGDLNINAISSILLASGGRLHVGGDATLAAGSVLGFDLANTGEAGKMKVDGTLYNEGATLKVSSTGPLVRYSEHELILAGSIDNPFETFVTNEVLSVYALSLAQSATNVAVTVEGVKDQTTPTPSMARASVAAANVVMNNISKYSSIARKIFRDRRASGETPVGPSGPESRIATGEWVAYVRQFNDLGGLDSEGAKDGFDWQTSGYMIGMEKLAGPQLIIGLGGGQAWTDLDGLRGSGGGASEMFLTSLYGNWFKDDAYCDVGLLYVAADNDTERIDTALDRYTGDYDSEMFGGWVEAGWLVRKAQFSELEPYIRSAYVSGNHEGYTDAGGTAPMTVSDNGTDNWQVEGGARLSREWRLDNAMRVRLEMKTGALCELLDNSVTVNSVVAGASQRPSSPEADRTALVLGVRADMGVTDTLNVGVGYEPTFSGNWQNHAIDFLLAYEF